MRYKEGVRQARSCVNEHACGVVEVAKDEVVEGKVDKVRDERRGKEIRRASVVSAMACTCEIEYESAVHGRSLDHISKTLESCFRACVVGKRVAGSGSGVKVRREGAITIRHVYAHRPVGLRGNKDR
jgi:hypothetical protein